MYLHCLGRIRVHLCTQNCPYHCHPRMGLASPWWGRAALGELAVTTLLQVLVAHPRPTATIGFRCLCALR